KKRAPTRVIGTPTKTKWKGPGGRTPRGPGPADRSPGARIAAGRIGVVAPGGIAAQRLGRPKTKTSPRAWAAPPRGSSPPLANAVGWPDRERRRDERRPDEDPHEGYGSRP